MPGRGNTRPDVVSQAQPIQAQAVRAPRRLHKAKLVEALLAAGCPAANVPLLGAGARAEHAHASARPDACGAAAAALRGVGAAPSALLREV